MSGWDQAGDIADLEAQVGDAADVLEPPPGFMDWMRGKIEDRKGREASRANHPSNQPPVEYDLDELLSEG